MTDAVGPAYEIQGLCSNPGCDKPFAHRHHLVRRSELAGAYDWIEYEGVLIQNVVGLCFDCHHEVTENKAMIIWDDLGFFAWVSMDGQDHEWGVEKRLDPHPQIGTTPDMSGVYVPAKDPELCPTCKRPHRRKNPDEKARHRKQWSISVPVDERENGADTLDTLLEEARKMMAVAGLPYGDEDNARFFVLCGALGLFVLHGEGILS